MYIQVIRGKSYEKTIVLKLYHWHCFRPACSPCFHHRRRSSGNLFSCSTSRDAENDILVDFKEVQITLPSSWAGKCQVSTATDSASFFHIQSRKLWTASLGYENGGFLFSINFSENMDFTDLPSYQLIGENRLPDIIMVCLRLTCRATQTCGCPQ